MTFSRGLLLDGKVLDVPGSELIIRDSRAWWDWENPLDKPDLRRRLGPVRVKGGHWTAGHCRTGMETARHVVSSMKARKKDDDGDGVIDADDPLMDVSVGFVNGWDGLLFQTCDLRFATVHMGRWPNPISFGTENTWPGSAKQARKLGYTGKTEMRRFGGRRLECLIPSAELIHGYVVLCRMLSSPELHAVTNGFVSIGRTFASPRSRRGHIEHWGAPSTKNDAADYLNDALRRDGWR